MKKDSPYLRVEWQRRRLEIFSLDEWTCILCGVHVPSNSEQPFDDRTPQERVTFSVHHPAYERRKKASPWAYADQHLWTVCEKCHLEEQDRHEATLRVLAECTGGPRRGGFGRLEDVAVLLHTVQAIHGGCDITEWFGGETVKTPLQADLVAAILAPVVRREEICNFQRELPVSLGDVIDLYWERVCNTQEELRAAGFAGTLDEAKEAIRQAAH